MVTGTTVRLTIRGNLLTDLVEVHARGFTRLESVPENALPVCETCEKPELSHNNLITVNCYRLVANQQMWGAMGGECLGVRLEAVVAAIRWLYEAGEITDDEQDVVMERIWIVDSVATRLHNEKLEARRKAAEEANRRGRRL